MTDSKVLSQTFRQRNINWTSTNWCDSGANQFSKLSLLKCFHSNNRFGSTWWSMDSRSCFSFYAFSEDPSRRHLHFFTVLISERYWNFQFGREKRSVYLVELDAPIWSPNWLWLANCCSSERIRMRKFCWTFESETRFIYERLVRFQSFIRPMFERGWPAVASWKFGRRSFGESRNYFMEIALILH